MVATSTRRHFLQGSGALVIAFALPSGPIGAQTQTSLPGNLQSNRMLDAWLAIQPTGKVTIFTGKIELGQGIGTAIAQIAADELGVDLARIEIVTGDTAR